MSSSWSLCRAHRAAQGVGLGRAGAEFRALSRSGSADGSVGLLRQQDRSHTVAGMGAQPQDAFSVNSLPPGAPRPWRAGAGAGS